jgi:hypothetical protein
MSSRAWTLSAAVLLAAAAPAAAQPPSPMELARGIRESGMPDLALEYLAELEQGKKLSAADLVVLPLERARCLLDAADDEPDEGTRAGMVNAAKVGFNTFLAASANHPRAAEASLSLARLTAIEAKAQLNRARRMDVPPPPAADAADKDAKERERDAALAQQRKEADAARPLFQRASTLFAEAAAQLKARIDAAKDPAAKAALERERFDADLAAAINVYNQADTVLATGAKVGLERNKLLERARDMFGELAKGPVTSRTVWVARAWRGEVLSDMGVPKEQEAEFAAILAARQVEAEDGKRLVQFFQVRRAYLEAVAQDATKLPAAVTALRGWLARHGNTRKPTPEVLAARYYLAFALERQALAATARLKPNPTTGAVDLPADARRQYEEAERLYRALTQSDHDYTARATQHRMFVVRRLIGEADKPAADYASFENAQMASLIQMAKLADAEAAAREAGEPDAAAPFWAGARAALATARVAAEVKDRKVRVVALLERARELATDKDNPADVADTLLRLVYYYQTTGQPHQAAVLGEHVARTVRAAGGKGARAGLLALYALTSAAPRVKEEAGADPAAEQAAAALRAVDRKRAIALAAYVDETFPKDPLADNVRHQLALLLLQDGQPDRAFEAAARVGPGYADAPIARQLQAYLAGVLTEPKSGVPDDRKRDVFRRTVADLARVPQPGLGATEAEVRGYLGCRVRLAGLYLNQSRVDPEAQAKADGSGLALQVADGVIALIPRFDALAEKDKALNLDGLELHAQALELRTRTLLFQARTLAAAGKGDEAAAAVAAAAAKGPVLDARAQKLTQPADADEPAVAAQKARVITDAGKVDQARQDLILVGFKVRCAQGNQAEAQAMLDRLKQAGGIEGNQKALEGVTRELAFRMGELRREGKKKEADDLGAGLALLIKEVSALPKLEAGTVLFLGQTLHAVGRFDEAAAEFRKIPAPSEPDWATRSLDDYPQEKRGQIAKEIREYRFAHLWVARSLRGGGKLDDAEKLLQAAVGTPEKRGWASSSLDFRKELAALYEAKGAAQTDPKLANPEWGKALKEWTALVASAQAGQKALKEEPPEPKDPALRGQWEKDRAAWVEERRRVRSNYLDAFFEVQRVLVEANTRLIKDPPKLAAQFENVAKQYLAVENVYKLAELEAKGEGAITPAVWNRYSDLLDAHAPLKAAYQAAGGKFFLTRPPKPPAN